MKDAVATMGGILPDDVGGRDAVHVAVISVVAGEKLMPGQDVGLSDERRANGEQPAVAGQKHIGIVDPFLKATVWPDQRFWLYLYPRTITSLRHNWTHPDFDDASGIYAPPSRKLASEQWIRRFADMHGETYEEMMEAARAFVKHGDYFVRGGKFEGEYVPDEFWDHYQVVTGKAVEPDKQHNFFSCTC